MLTVDYREGSKALIDPLRAMGLPVEEGEIDSDIEFVGRGNKGVPVNVGIEYKQLRECVGSLRTERLQGLQLPRMNDGYDFKYLLLEGELLWNPKSGALLRRAGKKNFKPMPGSMTVGELLKRLNVMHLRSGLNWHRTMNQRETLKYVETLYRVWTDMDLDQHTSHVGVYNPPTPRPVSKFRQAVMRWPGVGYRTSLAIEERFGGSVRRASGGTVEEYAGLTTVDDKGKSRRFGEPAAQTLVNFLEGR